MTAGAGSIVVLGSCLAGWTTLKAQRGFVLSGKQTSRSAELAQRIAA